MMAVDKNADQKDQKCKNITKGSGTLNDCKFDATSTNTTQGKRTENQKKNKVKSNLDNNVVINEQQTLESDSNVVT